ALRDPRNAQERSADDERVYRALRGRPWNPCDWRGLGAILPDAARGDGWFEGLRQWLRLISVRTFGGADWTCADTTSAATAETRAQRRDMCALHAPERKTATQT
ncbi:MAG: hypothetical protein ACREH4_05675, partial [Vitreimonas sp.]